MVRLSRALLELERYQRIEHSLTIAPGLRKRLMRSFRNDRRLEDISSSSNGKGFPGPKHTPGHSRAAPHLLPMETFFRSAGLSFLDVPDLPSTPIL